MRGEHYLECRGALLQELLQSCDACGHLDHGAVGAGAKEDSRCSFSWRCSILQELGWGWGHGIMKHCQVTHFNIIIVGCLCVGKYAVDKNI